MSSSVQKLMVSSVEPLIEYLGNHPDIEYLMIHCMVSFWKKVSNDDLCELRDALQSHPSLKILVFSGNSWASLEQVGILIDFLQKCNCPINAIVFRVTDPVDTRLEGRKRGALVNKILYRAYTCPTLQKITFTTGISLDQESVWIRRMNQKMETILNQERIVSKY